MSHLYLIRQFSFILIVSIVCLLCVSCANVVTQAFLRQADIRSPVLQPPMQPVDTSMVGDLVISPRVSFNTAKSISGQVSSLGTSDKSSVGQVHDSGLEVMGGAAGTSINIIKPGELNWELPELSVGMDLDYVLTHFLVIPLGVDLAFSNNESLHAFNAGLGFYTTAKNLSIRFDAGVIFQSSSFDTRITVIQTVKPIFSSERTDTFYLYSKDKATSINPYLGLTISTSIEDELINYFLNVSYFGQSILDHDAFDPDPWYFPFPPYYDDYQRTRFNITAAFFNVFPGITIRLQDNMGLLLGARMYFETEIQDNSKSFFVVPVLKFNLIL